ncbi:M73 family metallopeptidase [Nocardioidaceae bacterium]|nr:M73 family metallopeptidase [Nocardioidaceae bacterium]
MKNSKRAGIVSASAATLIVGGVAFAAWTSTGTADGSVTAGTEKDLVVTTSNVSSLYPQKSVTIEFAVKNENPYSVRVTTVSPAATTATSAAGCPGGDVTFGEAALESGSSATLAEGASALYTATVTMEADAASACQGATFTNTYTATADSDVS